jgi:hypothetical protein
MNEILLFLLIAFTLITFVSLNKKIGSAGSFSEDILPNRTGEYPVGGITRVIYSGSIKKAQSDYNRLWSVTAIAGMDPGTANRQNELTVVYHQPGNGAGLQPYYPPSGTGKDFDAVSNKTNAFLPCDDVCVISSVSDFQYRHVLLPLDEVV